MPKSMIRAGPTCFLPEEGNGSVMLPLSSKASTNDDCNLGEERVVLLGTSRRGRCNAYRWAGIQTFEFFEYKYWSYF